ncbi:hypothetical protein ACH5RR_015505 [Cinchona calisaya]|uniref:Uncharacterized protein n=1 Tax=Cinchona calisaya TaxID=153742 RepID=A0ABD2ZV76_9GENT
MDASHPSSSPRSAATFPTKLHGSTSKALSPLLYNHQSFFSLSSKTLGTGLLHGPSTFDDIVTEVNLDFKAKLVLALLQVVLKVKLLLMLRMTSLTLSLK